MPEYKYLIIGGGMTADAAVDGIRALSTDGTIGMISARSNAPYTRPLLSKGLWKGSSLDEVWRGTEQKRATLHLGREARAIDRQARQVIDDTDTAYGYELLLLATGGTPRRLPFDDGRVIYFRTLDDYRRLHDAAGTRVAVIGGGFIGWEIAAALAMNGRQVTMVFPEDGIGARLYPPSLATFLNDYYRRHDVTILSNDEVVGLGARRRAGIEHQERRDDRGRPGRGRAGDPAERRLGAGDRAARRKWRACRRAVAHVRYGDLRRGAMWPHFRSGARPPATRGARR